MQEQQTKAQQPGQVGIATKSLSQGSAGIDKALRMRALGGSAVGSAVEWYDYFLYGTMAGIVFGPLFFPSDNPSVSLMLSFASFALAFLVRPVGGVLFSHIGDRIGRKKTLVVTLSLMGFSTMLMGFLPDYATVGIWAPILLTLLRLIQGLALGGEWGGGLLLAVEYAPRDQRGFYGAVPQTGALFGLALGSLAASITSSAFSDANFMSFGWRIPFLLSFILVLTGLWIRNRVDETPSFKKVKSEHLAVKVPVVETLEHHWRGGFDHHWREVCRDFDLLHLRHFQHLLCRGAGLREEHCLECPAPGGVPGGSGDVVLRRAVRSHWPQEDLRRRNDRHRDLCRPLFLADVAGVRPGSDRRHGHWL